MFKVEVIADSSGKWCSNQMRFATREEAEAYANNLACRWTAVRQWRVLEVESTSKFPVSTFERA